MTQVITYVQDDNTLAVVFPTPKAVEDFGIESIARKDVPAGKPYLFVEESSLPDYAFFAAWEADFSNPHGYGIGPNAWFIEQYQAELATLDSEKDADRISQLQQMIEVQQNEMGVLA